MKASFGYTLDDYILENQDNSQYQSNGTLVNSFKVTNTSSLNKLERDYSDLRFHEVLNSKQKIKFSVSDYKLIHKHIFQDIYPWAGETRLLDIMKGDCLFTPFQYIDRDLSLTISNLASNLNHAITKHEIGKNLGVFLGEVNRIHPFAEGNGRTQRAFVSKAIQDTNYLIDWSIISSDRMKKASIDAHSNNLSTMIKLMRDALIDKDSNAILHINNIPNDVMNNNVYLHYKNQSHAINGTITNVSEKYIVLKSTDSYIVLNRQEFEAILPSLDIGEQVDIFPLNLNKKTKDL